jgi:DNA-directed RNA polymerase specialized sigma subunit
MLRIDKNIYSSLEIILHIKRVLTEKLNRVPTIEELSKECELDSEHVAKVLVAADGFGCS